MQHIIESRIYYDNSYFYNLRVKSPDGGSYSVPLYVHTGSTDALQKAKEVAEIVLADITNCGTFDALKLVKEGTLPLKEFIEHRIVELLRELESKEESVQYKAYPIGGASGKPGGISLSLYK